MDVVIKTGFEKVEYNVYFNPATIPKGKKLIKSQHVYNVQELRRNGCSYLIKAEVIRQTSVGEKPYEVTLFLNEKRNVIKATCCCTYQQSGKCKHIAALIEFINNEESFTKTDSEQQWGIPSARQFAKAKYSKGKYFHEMFPSPAKRKILPADCFIDELDNCPLKNVMIEEAKGEVFLAVESLMISLLNRVELELKKEPVKEILEKFFIFVEKFEIYKSASVKKLDKNICSFYDKSIVMSKREIINLCCNTIGQSSCKEWFSARRKRISASQNVHSIKSRVRKTIESLVSDMLSPENINSSSTKYGKNNEPKARELYKKIYNVEVVEVGAIVSFIQPWLIISLDGVVIKNSIIVKIVEFKCPSTCEKIPVINYIEKKCNVKYLEFRNGVVQLVKSSIYYTQIQTQMYITGMSICDLFVYSPVKNGSVCVPVLRDEEFLKTVFPKCETFYFENFLPALYENTIKKTENSNQKRLFTGLDISNNWNIN